MYMDKDVTFNEFRKWFNQMFSLSFDGKFKGLSTLRNLFGSRFIEHLQYKLSKALNHSSRGYLMHTEVISMRLSGHTIKLYNR